MIPSKLVDYIDTGKPILNICKIERCPYLEYTNKYPVVADALTAENLEGVKNKVEVSTPQYAGKQIEHEQYRKSVWYVYD